MGRGRARGGGRARKFSRARKAYEDIARKDGRLKRPPQAQYDPDIDINWADDERDVRAQSARNVTPEKESYG